MLTVRSVWWNMETESQSLPTERGLKLKHGGRDEILVDFVDGVSRVESVSELNVLAGITHEELMTAARRRWAGRIALAAALVVFSMVVHPGSLLDHAGDVAVDAIQSPSVPAPKAARMASSLRSMRSSCSSRDSTALSPCRSHAIGR